MKNLAKWQFISLLSRGAAMALGIFQSFFIVRILTVGEYGLVQLAASIGGAFGIYQHLGLSSGSTREISGAKDKSEIFKIFITSVVIRYIVTVPIAVGLFYFSYNIAVERYNQPELLLPLRIYSIVLLFQGFQGILNSVIAGEKRFKTMFTYQALIAVISVLLYIPLVYYYKINGFFYAMFIFNVLATVVLGLLALFPLRKYLKFPDLADFKRLLKELLSISLAIYAVKVIFTMWEKSGPILLGLDVSPEIVGLFAFGMLYAKKLIHASDAITDINLPVLSDKYMNDISEYKKLFLQNFNLIFTFIVFAGVSAAFWSRELIMFVVGNAKYNQILPLITPLIFTFIFYSFIDIFKSSIFIPGKFVKQMVFGFVMLLLVTISSFYILKEFTSVTVLSSMAVGMLLGAISSFVYLVLLAHNLLGFKFFVHDHFLILIQAAFFSLAKDIDNVQFKIFIFLLFSSLYIWGIFIAKFISYKEVLTFVNKPSSVFKK